MRSRVMRSRLMCAAAMGTAVLMVVTLGVIRTSGQTRASSIPRGTDGRPKLDGIWQAMNTANWDLQDHSQVGGPTQLGALSSTPGGLGVVDGNEIPYRPEALAKKKANFAKRWSEDPEVKCYLPGVPRATYMPYPFQIVQSANKILIMYAYAGAVRAINLDKIPESTVDTWMGHSVARWEKDTLVVDVNAFTGQAWLDRAGNHHSDELKVTERYTMIGPDHINYEATLEDPKTFTRPWKISMPLYRNIDRRAHLVNYKCVEFSEEVLYGHLRKKPKP